MTTFVTGFPGFLGPALVERLVAGAPGTADLTCLVQSCYRQVAESKVDAIETRYGAGGSIELVEADIAEPDLGLGDRYAPLQASTDDAFHLAAVNDLGIEPSHARRVNVEGTRHVLGFLGDAPGSTAPTPSAPATSVVGTTAG